MADPLGYAVVTYDPRARRPFIGFMHATRAEATEALGQMRTDPRERHVVAAVVEVGDEHHDR